MAKSRFKKITAFKKYSTRKLLLILVLVFAVVGVTTVLYSKALIPGMVNQAGNTVITNAQIVAFLQATCGEEYEEAHDCIGKNLLKNAGFENAVEPYNSNAEEFGWPQNCGTASSTKLGKWYMSGPNPAFRGSSSAAYEGSYIARTAGMYDSETKDTNGIGNPNIGAFCQWVAIPGGTNQYATFARAWLRNTCAAYNTINCGPIRIQICFADASGNVKDGWCDYTQYLSDEISDSSYSYLTGPVMNQPSGAKFARFAVQVWWGENCNVSDPYGSCAYTGHDIYWDSSALVLKDTN